MQGSGEIIQLIETQAKGPQLARESGKDMDIWGSRELVLLCCCISYMTPARTESVRTIQNSEHQYHSTPGWGTGCGTKDRTGRHNGLGHMRTGKHAGVWESKQAGLVH